MDLEGDDSVVRPALCPVFIGRTKDLNQLEGALEAAKRGRGGLASLIGESGVGKTRLAAEVARRAGALGMETLWGSCSQADLGPPYLPLVEAAGNYMERVEFGWLRSELGAACGELARVFPQLGCQPMPFDSSDEPGLARLRLFESLLALLKIAAGQRGMLLVIEDLQWADSSTAEIVDYLARRVMSSRILLLVTCRDEAIHRLPRLVPVIRQLRRNPFAMVVEVEPLSAVETAKMVAAILGTDNLPLATVGKFHVRAGGSPLVIEEMMRAALATGQIARGADGWNLEGLAGLKPPMTLQEMMLARHEGLDPQAAELLRCAAVVGDVVNHDFLRQLSGLKGEPFEAAIAQCVQHQILLASGLGQQGYRFRHSLTREAIYHDMLESERQRRHATAAALLALRRDAAPIELCHHLLAAQRWAEAIPIGLAAARAAEAQYGYAEAAALYHRLLPHIAHGRERGLVLSRLGEANRWGSEGYPSGLRYLEEGIKALEDAGDPLSAAEFRISLSTCQWQMGRRAEAGLSLDRALAVLKPAGASSALAEAHALGAAHYAFASAWDAVVSEAASAIDVAGHVGSDGARIWALQWLGFGLAHLGRTEEGLGHLDRSYREAVEHKLPVLAVRAICNGLVIRLRDLRLKEAVELLPALEAIDIGSAALPIRAVNQSAVFLAAGDAESALAYADEGLQMAEETGSSLWTGPACLAVAAALADLGRLEEATAMLNKHADRMGSELRLRLDHLRLRLALDAGTDAGSAMDVDAMLAGWESKMTGPGRLAEVMAEALLASGRLEDAEKVASWLQGVSKEPADAYAARLGGRIALKKGQWEIARHLLGRSARFWKQAGYRAEESLSRRLLAEAMAAAGDPAGARLELRSALSSGKERGAVLEQRKAREQLLQLGLPTDLPTSEQVREALENIHKSDALARSPLVHLGALSHSESHAQGLHRLLTATIEEVTAVEDHRDAEAGRLLRDYYVRRLGSQELVAERLHLSRPTFYRRLQRGWEVLAERLGPLDDADPMPD